MKKFYILLGILLSVYILFRLYATLMTAGNQWEKIIEMPTELKKLEKEIQIEVKSNNVNFNEISKNEIKNCEAELGIYIYIYIMILLLNLKNQSIGM